MACLLSGGIDSPVAAYRMMRRGCSVLLVHFHSYPILSRASQEKVREIAALLTRYQLRSRLVLVAFGELQQQVLLAVPAELRVVVYRRLMFRIAERIARRAHARALVTGEVIGQVASQTLDNLTTIAAATSLEVLRPLVGMDKDEIVAQAERIETLAISNIPDQDCCQLFTPKHPSTRVRSIPSNAPKRRCRSRAWWTPRWQAPPWRISSSRLRSRARRGQSRRQFDSRQSTVDANSRQDSRARQSVVNLRRTRCPEPVNIEMDHNAIMKRGPFRPREPGWLILNEMPS